MASAGRRVMLAQVSDFTLPISGVTRRPLRRRRKIDGFVLEILSLVAVSYGCESNPRVSR